MFLERFPQNILIFFNYNITLMKLVLIYTCPKIILYISLISYICLSKFYSFLTRRLTLTQPSFHCITSITYISCLLGVLIIKVYFYNNIYLIFLLFLCSVLTIGFIIHWRWLEYKYKYIYSALVYTNRILSQSYMQYFVSYPFILSIFYKSLL